MTVCGMYKSVIFWVTHIHTWNQTLINPAAHTRTQGSKVHHYTTCTHVQWMYITHSVLCAYLQNSYFSTDSYVYSAHQHISLDFLHRLPWRLMMPTSLLNCILITCRHCSCLWWCFRGVCDLACKQLFAHSARMIELKQINWLPHNYYAPLSVH